MIKDQHAVVTGTAPTVAANGDPVTQVKVEFVTDKAFMAEVFSDGLVGVLWDGEGNPSHQFLRVHRTKQVENMEVSIEQVQLGLEDAADTIAFKSANLKTLKFEPMSQDQVRVQCGIQVKPDTLQSGQLDHLIKHEVTLNIA